MAFYCVVPHFFRGRAKVIYLNILPLHGTMQIGALLVKEQKFSLRNGLKLLREADARKRPAWSMGRVALQNPACGVCQQVAFIKQPCPAARPVGQWFALWNGGSPWFWFALILVRPGLAVRLWDGWLVKWRAGLFCHSGVENRLRAAFRPHFWYLW